MIKCTVTGREVYKNLCSILISRENITFENRQWCTFFSCWSYDDNLFWTYHPHSYDYHNHWKPDVNSDVEIITHDFYFFLIFEP